MELNNWVMEDFKYVFHILFIWGLMSADWACPSWLFFCWEWLLSHAPLCCQRLVQSIIFLRSSPRSRSPQSQTESKLLSKNRRLFRRSQNHYRGRKTKKRRKKRWELQGTDLRISRGGGGGKRIFKKIVAIFLYWPNWFSELSQSSINTRVEREK